jgi:hypothetical protein
MYDVEDDEVEEEAVLDELDGNESVMTLLEGLTSVFSSPRLRGGGRGSRRGRRSTS